MADVKCVYDPLVELMNYYAGKKGIRTKVDTSALPVEERLKQRIIDGDQIGVDADLDMALKAHDPLTIINQFLLDGMKVVGELFGSGQMQLPFVLQSAETMKKAVAYLEPFMEKSEDSSKGVIVLATVKGDVHDIGKNLVDIILTNNGYTVHNLGIKVPIDTMLDALDRHKAHAIGMSGLLVKSTMVMKENLQLMKGRGLDIPVILGGAALTRRYVEHDLRGIYSDNVVYAADAFDGLRYMELLHNNQPIATPAPPKTTAASDPAHKRLAAGERGEVTVRLALEEEVADLAELLGAQSGQTPFGESDSIYVALMDQRVIGGGALRRAGPGGQVELTNLTVVPEQAGAGVMMQLVRAMRRGARTPDAAVDVLVRCPAADAPMQRMLRAAGFQAVEEESGDVVTMRSKPDSALTDAVGGDQPAERPAYITQLPRAPFYGTRIVENVQLDKVYQYINQVALIRGQWQVRKGSRTAEEYHRELEDVVQPKFQEMKLLAKREGLLEPKVIYGYYPCKSQGDDLVLYKPRGLDGADVSGEWAGLNPEAQAMEEWQRFSFPRQSSGRRLCIADFFRGAGQPEYDVAAFHIVTVGKAATHYANRLFAGHNYADYLYFHGLAVETAEALAEYWHKSIRAELGIGGQDAADIRRLFSQGYRGSRYSFGYPACPNLEDQAKLFAMMRPERIGVSLSEEYMLEPEQSTSAIIVHHPEARYFMI